MGEQLLDWADLKDKYSWATLVVGNGLSINIWRDFTYNHLFEQASLDDVALRLFSVFETQNFETVLEALWHAEMTLKALGHSSDHVMHRCQQDHVTQLYQEVHSALFKAVRQVHPLRRIDASKARTGLRCDVLYRLVFTLNYDLLTYWAAMQSGSHAGIRDFFWAHDNAFDIKTAALGEDNTGLLYLHGGLHLWQDSQSGLTGKWTTTKGSGVTLLKSLQDRVSASPARRPLFVSEGTSAQKLAVIRRSDYLSYALQSLSDNASNTVVFGAAFADQDEHIATALRSGAKRHIAVSIRPGNLDGDGAAIANYHAKLRGHHLHFFDSTSHPLGCPSLTVR